MKVTLPMSTRKKALFVVDAQPDTLEQRATSHIDSIIKLICNTKYNLYVAASYHADKNSMFFKQGGWFLPEISAGLVDGEIIANIRQTGRPIVALTKTARSCFKSNEAIELEQSLSENQVEEVHIVGFDIDDCVMATAYDCIDRGYYTFIIEEACGRYDGDQNLIDAAIKILRKSHMTNNSSLLETTKILF
jgi:nicotinamidase-related amidase